MYVVVGIYTSVPRRRERGAIIIICSSSFVCIFGWVRGCWFLLFFRGFFYDWLITRCNGGGEGGMRCLDYQGSCCCCREIILAFFNRRRWTQRKKNAMVPSPLSALWLSLDEKEKVFWWSGIRQTNLCVHSELQSATRKHIARNKGHNKTMVFLASLVIFLPLLLPFFFFFVSLGSSTSVASFFLRDAGEILPFFPAGKHSWTLAKITDTPYTV